MKKGTKPAPKKAGKPGAMAPSGAGDRMIGRIGGGKVTDKGVKKK